MSKKNTEELEFIDSLHAIFVNDELDKIAHKIRTINKMNGWQPFTVDDWKNPDRFPRDIALIHSELSEALEAFRKDEHSSAAVELIDVVIRTLDVLGGLGVHITELLLMKLEYNLDRSYKHGGKRI